MTRLVLIGDYSGPECAELQRLVGGLGEYLNQAERRFNKATSFKELCIVLRCHPQDQGKYPRVRKHLAPGSAWLGAQVRIPPHKIKRTLEANIPVLTAAMLEAFDRLRSYYRRNHHDPAEIDALQSDYMGAFNVGAPTPADG